MSFIVWKIRTFVSWSNTPSAPSFWGTVSVFITSVFTGVLPFLSFYFDSFLVDWSWLSDCSVERRPGGDCLPWVPNSLSHAVFCLYTSQFGWVPSAWLILSCLENFIAVPLHSFLVSDISGGESGDQVSVFLTCTWLAFSFGHAHVIL